LDAGREHRCTRAEDCNQGACIEFQCVPQCAVATECRIGEVCTNQRCEPAPGCGCSSGGSAGGFAVLALVLLHRRSRSSPRSSIGPHAPSPGSPS
jgi:MYXO-CTERM domain-containing protein